LIIAGELNNLQQLTVMAIIPTRQRTHASGFRNLIANETDTFLIGGVAEGLRRRGKTEGKAHGYD
jgi:hypothetical protein